jgi:ribosomal protein S18 acetylase RimI-like enzyme
MQIREFDKNNEAEVKHLFQVQQNAYRIEAHLLGVEPESFYPMKETIEALKSSPDQGFVSVFDGQIVGAIFLEKSGETIIISKLVVDPNFFRRGIAKSLVGHCLDTNPGKVFLVGTGALNLPAIQLYQNFGFKIFKEELVEVNLKFVKLKRQ